MEDPSDETPGLITPVDHVALDGEGSNPGTELRPRAAQDKLYVGVEPVFGFAAFVSVRFWTSSTAVAMDDAVTVDIRF